MTDQATQDVSSHAADVFTSLTQLLASGVFQNALPVVVQYINRAEAKPAVFDTTAGAVQFATQFISDLVGTLPAIDKSSVQAAVALIGTLVSVWEAKAQTIKASQAASQVAQVSEPVSQPEVAQAAA